MNRQLGPVIVTDLIGRNFEVKSMVIALYFDAKLKKFNEVSFCHKNWCTFDGVEF